MSKTSSASNDYARRLCLAIERRLKIKISPHGLALLFGFLFYSAILCFFCSTASPFLRRFMSDDGEVFYYMGRAMQEGRVLYRDAFDHKGIYIFFINFLGASLDMIFPTLGLYIIEVFFRLLDCIFAYRIFRDFKLAPKLSVGLVFCFEALMLNYFTYIGGNFTESYAATLQIISIALVIHHYFVDKSDSHRALYMFIHGVCSGVCLMLRANMVAMWIPFGAVLFAELLFKKQFASFWRNALALCAGVFASFIPIILYCTSHNCFNEMLFGSFGFNMLYSSGIKGAFRAMSQLFTYRAGIVLWLALAAILITVLSRRTPLQIKIMLPLAFLSSYTLLFMSGRVDGYGHYYHYFVPLCLPIFIALGSLISDKFPKALHSSCELLRRPAIAAAVVALFILSTVCVNLKTPIKLFGNLQANELAKQSEGVRNALDGQSDEYLLCLGHVNSFYNATNMFAPTPYFHKPSIAYSIFPDAMDAQANAVITGTAKFVMLPKWSYARKTYSSGEIYILGEESLDAQIWDSLQSDYELFYARDTENLSVTIYRRLG